MATTQLTVDIAGKGWQSPFDPNQLGDVLTGQQNLVWLDICDPGPQELELLRSEFGFHELALEDVAKRHQRPKCDLYGGYHFIVVYAAQHALDTFVPHELQLFWGDNYLVTIHHAPLAVLDEVSERWYRHDDRQTHGVAYLVYALFDSLVDTYFAVQDKIGEQLEAIEGAIRAGDQRVAEDIFDLRKQLLHARKLFAPTGDVLAEALRRRPRLPESLRPYFADVQDHCIRVLGELDTQSTLLGTALDVHAESVFWRLGIIVKRLTAITVIIMVPNLVASVYGMNFTKLFPPADWDWGFVVVVGILVVMIIWGFIHSRMLDWL
jgi:magnesium transporter